MRVLGVGAAIALQALAQGLDLDAPVVRAPTVGSEIRRGQEDAFGCARGVGDLTDAQRFAGCVDGARDRDSRGAASSAFYLIGLYGFAAPVLERSLKPDATRFHDADGARLAKARLDAWRLALREALAATGVTIGDFCRAIDAQDVERCAKGGF